MEDFLKVLGSKKMKYEHCLVQISALLEFEQDLIANMANISAILKAQFDFFWVGFYRVQGNILKVGPFQGPLACSSISRGKGVCGECWELGSSIIVSDVNQHTGHIACNSLSQSEIVIPIFQEGKVVAVLDLDSDKFNDFNEEDQYWLEKIANLLA